MFKRRNFPIGIFPLAIGALPFSVCASGLLEEIVVTAQKREQNIQDVGIAITAFTGDQVEKLGWHTAEDMGAQTPGLITTSFNGDSASSFFVVRGVGQADFGDQHEAPTVTYRDGAYIPSMSGQAVQMFDIERVEALKGPQGTLFGRNATGGLVHILSRKPTEEFEGYVELGVAEYDNISLQGAVSGSLTDDVQGRLSFIKNDANGYIDNSIGPDLHEKDDAAVRAQLQTQFTDRLEGHLALNYSNVDDIKGVSNTPVLLPGTTSDYSGFVPNSDPFKASMGGDTGLEKESYQLTATFTYDVTDSITMTSITDYQENKTAYRENTGGDPTQQFTYITGQDVETVAQELRFNGASDQSSWTAGVYYLNIDGDFNASFSVNDFPPFANISAIPSNEFSLETESWAIFGQFDYELTSSLSVTAGLRYTEDRKDLDLTASCASGPNPITGDPNPVISGFGAPFDGLGGCDAFGTTGGLLGPLGTPTTADAGHTILDRNDDDFTAKIQLDWRVNDATLIYAGFNRGMKAGGYSPSSSASTFVEDLEYNKEVLHAYEIGLKTELFDGRARVNAATFYYDYRDYQAFFLVGATNVVDNHDAEIYGGEIEVFAEPGDGWSIVGGLSLLNGTVEDIPGVGDQDILLAPDLTANLLVRKEWDLSNGDSIAFQVDGVYVDEQTSNSINTLGAAVDDYTVWNSRLTYARGDDWEISLYVRNVGDEEYWTYAFDASHLIADNETLRAYAPPRYFGGSIRFNW